MSRPVSRVAVVWSIVKKDLTEYSRDKLWAFLTVLTLVMMIVIFWVLPDSVDESIAVGISGVGNSALFASLQAAEEGGLELIPFDSAEDLKSVITGDATAWRFEGQTVVIANKSDEEQPAGSEKATVIIGLSFPADFFAAITSGQKTTVEIFVDAQTPREIRTAMSGMVRELAFAVAGNQLPVVAPQELYVVLGEERIGNQVTPRESLRPLFIFMILLMEMFGMSSLIAREIQNRTVTALVVTPAKTGDILAAKGITGLIMGLSQAVILFAAFNMLSTQPLLLLLLMLLGALMVSGTAMIAGTLGRDFMSNLFYGFAFMIPLLIPAFGALFPGSGSAWVKVLPSYPLVQGLVKVTTYGDGWADTLGEIGTLFAWCVGLFAIGWIVLKRKVERI
jgi:ABC-2 type transport system permease protein